MGNGRYSEKLSYSQWYKFNNAQRAHYNLVESAPSIFAFLFISGLYFPIPSAVLGLVVVISRIIYSIGYVSGGPGGRLIGALLVDLALLGFLGLSFASSIMFAMGKASVWDSDDLWFNLKINFRWIKEDFQYLFASCYGR